MKKVKKTKSELIKTFKKANQSYKQTLLKNNPKLSVWLNINDKEAWAGAAWGGKVSGFKW